jgi:hypothetical protein
MRSLLLLPAVLSIALTAAFTACGDDDYGVELGTGDASASVDGPVDLTPPVDLSQPPG